MLGKFLGQSLGKSWRDDVRCYSWIDLHFYSDIAVCCFVAESRKSPAFLAPPSELLGYGGLGHGAMVSCLGHLGTRSAAMLCRKMLPARTRPRFAGHDKNPLQDGWWCVWNQLSRTANALRRAAAPCPQRFFLPANYKVRNED